jgi:hypothetical protein
VMLLLQVACWAGLVLGRNGAHGLLLLTLAVADVSLPGSPALLCCAEKVRGNGNRDSVSLAGGTRGLSAGACS